MHPRVNGSRLFFPAIAESQVQAMQGGRVLLSPFDAVVGLYVPVPGDAELGVGAWRGAAPALSRFEIGVPD